VIAVAADPMVAGAETADSVAVRVREWPTSNHEVL